MTQEEIEIVKSTIRNIVEEHIDSQINYEWEGSDFTERLMDDLPIDEKMSFEVISQSSSSDVQFDNELYQKFLTHLTEFIFGGLEFGTDEKEEED
jgi:hypothetical protein